MMSGNQMAMTIVITQAVLATLDWERVADAARDEFDKTVSQVIDEPVAGRMLNP